MEAMSDNNTGDNNTDASAASHAASNGDLVRIGHGDYLYWEDLQPSTFDLGEYTFTQQEILEFAGRFDPQPFHVDPQAAEQSQFGGLIASGWHTGSVYMGLYARNFLNYTASLGSPGVENLRWLAPVRPGDVVRGTVEIVRSQPSGSNPKRGTVFFVSQLVNQDDVVVYHMEGRGMFGRRTPATG
jgi:acyl dehydratase